MPLTEANSVMRALSPSAPASYSAWVSTCGALRFTAITASQYSGVMLARVLSRVMPALCTTMSIPPGNASSNCAAASLAQMSRPSALPPNRAARASRSCRACGTSSSTTSAPSRARVSAIAAPIPRAAPVTRARRPPSGRVQSSTWLAQASSRRTWPEMNALLGERKKRRAPSSWSSAPWPTYSNCAVAPLRSSLPSERLKPSSARCATLASGSSRLSGARPRITTWAQAARLRSNGWKNSRNCLSSSLSER
ncbi:hypothetical protein D3C81_1302030 [compost metagenome]